jgi:hypothetical protein
MIIWRDNLKIKNPRVYRGLTIIYQLSSIYKRPELLNILHAFILDINIF